MNDNQIDTDTVRFFICETEKILNFFQRQVEKTFKASSVLYINGKNGRRQVRYIDFAHAEDANGVVDSNVIEGLQGVIDVWKRLL